MFRTILGSDQPNSMKNTEIKKQSYVKFWFNRKKCGAVLYYKAVFSTNFKSPQSLIQNVILFWLNSGKKPTLFPYS